MPPAPQTPPDGSDGPRLTPRVVLFRIIGVVAVGLAAIGAVLPLMPTTVFLLIALWAFARGSPALADRLRNHSRFGPMIRDWEERGAIPVKARLNRSCLTATTRSRPIASCCMWALS